VHAVRQRHDAAIRLPASTRIVTRGTRAVKHCFSVLLVQREIFGSLSRSASYSREGQPRRPPPDATTQALILVPKLCSSTGEAAPVNAVSKSGSYRKAATRKPQPRTLPCHPSPRAALREHTWESRTEQNAAAISIWSVTRIPTAALFLHRWNDFAIQTRRNVQVLRQWHSQSPRRSNTYITVHGNAHREDPTPWELPTSTRSQRYRLFCLLFQAKH
jgi:hypothetical protein